MTIGPPQHERMDGEGWATAFDHFLHWAAEHRPLAGGLIVAVLIGIWIWRRKR